MKIGKNEFHMEELIFLLAVLAFFIFICVGSFHYRPAARFFPLILSVPAIVLLCLYVLRGFFPSSVGKMMIGVGELTMGASVSEKLTSEEKAEAPADSKISTLRAYLIFAYTISFMLFSYFIGFYLSTIIFLCVYLFITREKSLSHLVGNFILAVILVGIVYLFDIAFGHHFGRGVILSFPG